MGNSDSKENKNSPYYTGNLPDSILIEPPKPSMPTQLKYYSSFDESYISIQREIEKEEEERRGQNYHGTETTLFGPGGLLSIKKY